MSNLEKINNYLKSNNIKFIEFDCNEIFFKYIKNKDYKLYLRDKDLSVILWIGQYYPPKNDFNIEKKIIITDTNELELCYKQILKKIKKI